MYTDFYTDHFSNFIFSFRYSLCQTTNLLQDVEVKSNLVLIVRMYLREQVQQEGAQHADNWIDSAFGATGGVGLGDETLVAWAAVPVTVNREDDNLPSSKTFCLLYSSEPESDG